MAVKIGSARIDENGHISGGRAGDQTGKEVSTQAWYKHSKGWRVFRAKSAEARERIAWDMQAACDNPHIGYDQGQRGTLYSVSKPLGFNCAKVTANCETDCSALVRVCCAYAGILLGAFNTSGEASALLGSGKFTELTAAKYTDNPDYLLRGDILVTKSKGHTAVVLTSGSRAAVAPAPVRDLRKGDKGPDVRALQQALNTLGWSFPLYGIDGDFGAETEANVKGFQRVMGLPVTGVVDQATRDKLTAATHRHVTVTGGGVWIRSGPSADYGELGIVHKGDILPYGGETSGGWYLIEWQGVNGWISGKYAELSD